MKFLPIEELPIVHEAYTLHTFVIDGVEHQIIGCTVQVGDFALRTNWTPELVQDLQVFHNIDAEAELTRILEQELLNAAEQAGAEMIAQGMDRKILRDLHRMGNQQDPGYIYAPYIPMIPIIAENEFQPREGIMTRYARRAVNLDYYQVVRIANSEFPDGIRFKLTPAIKVEGMEFYEIAKMSLPKGGAKEKLRSKVLEKWTRAGMFDNFIVEELPE